MSISSSPCCCAEKMLEILIDAPDYEWLMRTQASRLIEGIDADHLLADNAYDTDVILAQAASQGMDAVIPPKKNRKDQRRYDAELYKQKTPNRSSPPSKSAVLSAGQTSRDYTI